MSVVSENKRVSRMRIVFAGTVLYSFTFYSYTFLNDHFLLSGAVIDDCWKIVTY